MYEVVNVEVLTTQLRALRPNQASEIGPAIPRRAANIAQSRSSKGRSHGYVLHYLLIKLITDGVIWRGKSLQAEESRKPNSSMAALLTCRWRPVQPAQGL